MGKNRSWRKDSFGRMIILICFIIISGVLLSCSENWVKNKALLESQLSKNSVEIPITLLDEKYIEKITSQANHRFGKTVELAEVFVYYDYHDQPFARVLSFRSCADGKIVGTMYRNYDENIIGRLGIVMKTEAVHKYAWEEISEWLPKILGQYERIELLRVYYHPSMYPILKVRIVKVDGSHQSVIVDPVFQKVISEEKLKSLKKPYPGDMFEF